MNLILLFLIPSLLAILVLPFIADRFAASVFSFLCATATFCFAVPLALYSYHHTEPLFFLNQYLLCDKLSAFFILLNSFITMTTSFYAIIYLNNENKSELYPLIYRFYHTFFHLFTFCMLVVILSNNIALLWIAMELATISSVVLVALYQTKAALEAAWKYLILCGVGIALALLGVVIFYFAAQPDLNNTQALLWTFLMQKASLFSPLLLSISFIFLLVGFGTKVGFFPLHNWLPDAHAEAPSPISALLSGLLLNVALFAILRFKLILAHTVLASLTSHLLLLFGIISLLFAAFSLLRQRQLKRLFAYSSIEHMGLISIALGIGTPLAYFVALLHIAMHALSKTAAFFCSGSIIQRFHTQTISQLKGLCDTTPSLGWCLLLCSCAILGLPPSGLFWSELLLILAALKSNPWLLIPIILGLSVAFFALLSKIQRVAFSQHPTTFQPQKNSALFLLPSWLHLVLIVIAGIFIPYALIQPVVHLLIMGN